MNVLIVSRRLRRLVFALAAISPCLLAQDAPTLWGVSLSWSPEFCNAEPENIHELQCTEPHNFVLGGFERLSQAGPSGSCTRGYPEIPLEVSERMLPVMWNERTMRREWRAHGSCSGWQMMDYFIKADYVAQKVVVPDLYNQPFGSLDTNAESIRRLFTKSNRDLGADAIMLRCDGRWLREVVICVGKDQEYQSCGVQAADSCRDPIRFRGVNPRLKPGRYG